MYYVLPVIYVFCFVLFFSLSFFFSVILNILIEACGFDNSWGVLLVGGGEGILLKFSLIRGEFRIFSCGVRGSHILDRSRNPPCR